MRKALIWLVSAGLVAGGVWSAQPAHADLPMCTATGCAFLAQSGNIDCEIDINQPYNMPDVTYCQTSAPPQSVHLAANGTITTCLGQSCLGNPGYGPNGERTPSLADGQTVGLGPFGCAFASNMQNSGIPGVDCKAVPSGHGFVISSSGITPV